MRIAVFSTESSGSGAARAMRRLVAGLAKRGHHVDLLLPADGRAPASAIQFHPEDDAPDALELSRFVEDYYIPRRRSPLSDTLFSAQSRGYDLGSFDWLRSYDVLNLHWVQNFLNPEAITRLVDLGRPVVFTLHDMAPFTGGCHYTAGCDGYAHSCAPCPQLNDDACELPRGLLAVKRQAYARPHVAAVAPSRWLAGAAARSGVFAADSVHHLWNSVETDLFRPLDPADARAALGIDPDARTILFGAYHNSERRKGFRHLMAAIRRLRLRSEIRELVDAGKLKVLIFGQATPEMDEAGLPVVDLGYVVDDRKLVQAYSAATLVVLPSLEDNQPNILLEAMACATPVVSFAIGGMVDVIEDGVNGRLVPPFDVASLAQAIFDLLMDPAHAATLGAEARQEVVEHGALDVQARNYEALFEKMASSVGRAPVAAPSPAQLGEGEGQRAIAVPNLVSPRMTRPEIMAARERYASGVDRYITPATAAAARLAALESEMEGLSDQLDHQAKLLLSSRAWRLGRLTGLGSALTAAQIAEMGSLSEKLWAVWAVMHSRRWEAMAPLRLFNRLLHRPGESAAPRPGTEKR